WDNAASAVGIGATQPGQAFLSLGTSGVYFVSSSEFRPNVPDGIHTFCHCLPGLWHQMSVHLSAAANLHWIKGVLGIDTFDTLYAMADKTSTKLLFLPYLSGIRTPYNDPYARGVFFGLNAGTTKEEMVRSILEGVAFDLADGQEAILKGASIQEVSVVGGGARSYLWGRILATILQQTLTYREHAELGGALGAARLARLSQEANQDPAQMLKPPKVLKIIEPAKDDYDKKRMLFKHLYRQLKPCFQEAL
ncbi:MAG: xylulose kinase, partial [uncultured bacterium]